MTPRITLARAAELAALSQAAGPGPWEWLACVKRDGTPTWRFGSASMPFALGHTLTEADAEFVAAARTVVPDLLADLAEAREALERAAETFDDLAGGLRVIGHETVAEACQIARDATLDALGAES